MLLPADYHMHTPLCKHATGEPTELAAQAVRLGLAEIGFSDHNPMPRDGFDAWRMDNADLETYVAKVEQARRDHPQLVIKLALEVDFLPGYEDWVRKLASAFPWDYLIGSVHYLTPPWAIDDPSRVSDWKRHDPREVWTNYCQRLTEAVESGLFDIIGHADLCKKFCFFPAQTDKFKGGDYSELFVPFLEAASRRGVAMELNTAGLRKDCKEIYPSPAIVVRAARMGVPITFGSDAHAPEEVGLNLAEAVQLARGAGYTHCCRFTRRKKEVVEI
jgi:histidinol-phosphatase (PHP family)